MKTLNDRKIVHWTLIVQTVRKKTSDFAESINVLKECKSQNIKIQYRTAGAEPPHFFQSWNTVSCVCVRECVYITQSCFHFMLFQQAKLTACRVNTVLLVPGYEIRPVTQLQWVFPVFAVCVCVCVRTCKCVRVWLRSRLEFTKRQMSRFTEICSPSFSFC